LNTRLIAIADLHAGSSTALTVNPRNEIQEKVLTLYEETITHFGPEPDVVLVNGDAIQGCSTRNRDVKIATATEQAVDAAQNIYKWKAKKEYIIIGGTGFHTESDGEDMDRFVCGELEKLLRADKNVTTKVTYYDKLKAVLNGWFRVEARHKIGASSIPHGRATSPMRSKMWNVLSAAAKAGGGPVAMTHLFLFAHVHYYLRQEDDLGCVVILPCWQAIGNKYGSRECDGLITLGTTQLVVGEDTWSLDTKRYSPAVVGRWENK
jgi:hypothetical protein